MRAYESCRMTLDRGLTALALRRLHERDGHYPFVDGAVRHRRPGGGSARADDAGWLRPFPAFLAQGRGAAPLMRASQPGAAPAAHTSPRVLGRPRRFLSD